MRKGRRLLIYSHDSFGLGHLRRCRAIAHHLVDRFPALSVLILSGSPIIGSFEFKSRVDFVRVPGVIKLRDSGYTSLSEHIDIDTTLRLRSSIIWHTAEIFEPDMFIVDKEPLGLRGEVGTALELLRAQGVRCVLGLRDVMDDPAVLIDEWDRKNVFPALRTLYDEIWVYGLPQIFDPVGEIPGFAQFAHKTRFTGYLRRNLPRGAAAPLPQGVPDEPFILVTTGGGGDGEDLVDRVISAYEHDPGLRHPAVILFGPFLESQARYRFRERIERDPRLTGITFDAQIERLYSLASGIVAMGGYNTFCEILSFGKPAIVMPRSQPRREQLLRIERAAALGLLEHLPEEADRSPARMAALLRRLPNMPVAPLETRETMLRGLDRLTELAAPWLLPDETRSVRFA